jgi:hypothetical protein
MKTIIKIYLVLSLLVLFSCENKDELIDVDSDKLIGYWTNPVLNDSIWTYDRADGLKSSEYGFVFNPGQVFNERKNAGWCGTPPVSYADFDGMWNRSGSFINITVGYWGGVADYQWKILSLANDKLVIYKMKEVFHNEY